MTCFAARTDTGLCFCHAVGVLGHWEDKIFRAGVDGMQKESVA